MIWTLTIPAVPPGLNRTTRMHWTVINEAKKRWWLLIHNSLVAHPIPKATGRRRLSINVYTAGNLPQDDDNLRGGCKEVLTDNLRPPKATDCIIRKGEHRGQHFQKRSMGHALILDDNRQWLEWGEVRALQVDSRAEERTVVVLEDCDGPTTAEQRREEVYRHALSARWFLGALLGPSSDPESRDEVRDRARALLEAIPADLKAFEVSHA